MSSDLEKKLREVLKDKSPALINSTVDALVNQQGLETWEDFVACHDDMSSANYISRQFGIMAGPAILLSNLVNTEKRRGSRKAREDTGGDGRLEDDRRQVGNFSFSSRPPASPSPAGVTLFSERNLKLGVIPGRASGPDELVRGRLESLARQVEEKSARQGEERSGNGKRLFRQYAFVMKGGEAGSAPGTMDRKKGKLLERTPSSSPHNDDHPSPNDEGDDAFMVQPPRKFPQFSTDDGSKATGAVKIEVGMRSRSLVESEDEEASDCEITDWRKRKTRKEIDDEDAKARQHPKPYEYIGFNDVDLSTEELCLAWANDVIPRIENLPVQ
jgi:hypothetical protein